MALYSTALSPSRLIPTLSVLNVVTPAHTLQSPIREGARKWKAVMVGIAGAGLCVSRVMVGMSIMGGASTSDVSRMIVRSSIARRGFVTNQSLGN